MYMYTSSATHLLFVMYLVTILKNMCWYVYMHQHKIINY